MVEKLLAGVLEGQRVVYFDDILLHTRSLKEHIILLEQVLGLHEEHHVLLNPKKTKILRDTVAYLGFKITSTGYSIKADYLQKLRSWPIPSSLMSVDDFLGFISYYRALIPQIASRTRHLSELRKRLRNKEAFYWGDQEEKEFQDLIQALLKAPIAAFPDWGRKGSVFVLSTDWSCHGLGIVVTQVQQSVERLVAACGRRCSPSEANYSSLKGELLPIVFPCRKLAHLLIYKPFVVRTDALWLQTVKKWTKPF